MTQSQPPVLLTQAVQPADTGGGGGGGGGGATTTVAGSITLNIANHTFTLTGTLGQHMIVEYHAAFEDSISLGSISDIATAVASAFNFSGSDGIDKEITTVGSSLTSVPVLKEIYGVFTHAQIRITDLEINTQTSTYGVGLAMDFTQLPPGILPQGQTVPTLLGIELLSLGFKVTKVNPNPPTGS